MTITQQQRDRMNADHYDLTILILSLEMARAAAVDAADPAIIATLDRYLDRYAAAERWLYDIITAAYDG